MTTTKRAVAVFATFAVAASVLATGGGRADAARSTRITLVTHDSFSTSKRVLAAFTRQTGVEVRILQAGDTGTVVNQAILTKDNPVGDVLFGVDNTFLERALDAGIFEPYTARGIEKVPEEFRLDPTNHVTPVDYGDVCINYDKRWFRRRALAPPLTLDDLAEPDYRDALVVENPATSSPGLAFLLATVARYGDDGWRDYWRRLRANGVKVVDDWETAYYAEFTQGGGGGAYPLVVSYASSPPAAVHFADPPPRTSPIGTMLDSCFRQVEFAGVLAGTKHRAAARRLVDFMLSPRFQRDIPLQMFVFPVREGIELPEVFVKFADVPEEPLSLPAADIARHRDEWIEQWTDTVLR